MDENIQALYKGRKIELLWLIDSLTTGGAERLVPMFAGKINRDRFNLTVACLKVIRGNQIAKELDDMGITIKLINSKNLRDIKGFYNLYKFIKQNKFDIIHTHLTYSDIWGRLVGSLNRETVLSTVHVPEFFNYYNPSIKDKLIEKIAVFIRNNFGNKVVSVSDFLGNHHISNGLNKEKTVTIHNGIDLGKFNLSGNYCPKSKKVDLGIHDDFKVVTTLSVLREGKGHKKLIQSIPTVIDKNKNTIFLIVGGGPLETELKELCNEHKISENVLFTGMRQDTNELLDVSDIFVHPAEDDPLPTVVLEAMTMRLPVIAMDSGGVPEMVIDGETGLLVKKPYDYNDLSNLINKLIENPKLSNGMGKSGRNRIENNFTSEIWVNKLEHLYLEVLNNEPV